MITFSVKDTGIGIPGSVRPKLFKPFMQADVSIIRKHAGTGLGLAILRRLVDLMNGAMGFESVEGTGSTFWFSLPSDENLPEIPADNSAGGMEPQKQKSLDDYSGKKPVLIVEDNLLSRDLFAMQLRQFGLTTRLVNNGEEAAELVHSDPDSFSLILMDLHMPKMDGMTATRLIRQREAGTHRHIPIVAITADAVPGSREQCIQAGMDDFMSKPLSLSDINSLLRKFLRGT